MASYDEWKMAVVHLECATDSQSLNERIHLQDELWKKLDKGEISADQYMKSTSEIFSKNFRAKRFQGTAIFIEHDSRYFLLTARHVLYDEISARSILSDERIPSEIRDRMAKDKIYNIIFRIPSYDEFLQARRPIIQIVGAGNVILREPSGDEPPPTSGPIMLEPLMNLGAGTSDMLPYTFSGSEIDLAVISLRNDPFVARFTQQLFASGYSPISSADILDEPSAEGADIYTIGYPDSISTLGEFELPLAMKFWASSFYSLPASSFGKVSMLHDELPYFWGDMSIFPGNSGGPVIENGNLVGIVVAQPPVKLTQNEALALEKESEDEKMVDYVIKTIMRTGITSRGPFANITKSKFVMDLLTEQIKKDDQRQTRMGSHFENRGIANPSS